MGLQIRHLAESEFVGVVGPRYPHQPEDSLQKLRDTTQATYWWPEHPETGVLPSLPPLPVVSGSWQRVLPRKLRLLWLRRLAGIAGLSDDAVAWRQALTNLAPKILEALNRRNWQLVLLSQSTSACWLPFLPSVLPRCICLHDIRSDYLARATPAMPAGQLKRLRDEEKAAVTQVDAVTVVSALDRERAERLLKPTVPVAVLPICVDLEYFAFRPREAKGDPLVLFTGHLSHPPNIDSVLWLLREVWPQILRLAPQATLRIVGLQPAAEVVAAAASASRTELLPNVADIRPHFHQAGAYVVPMRYGGGVRQKILEAWALGTPVVSTTMGAEGVAARDEGNCWLRDTPEEFANKVAELLQAESAPLAVLKAARRVVEENHSMRVSGSELTKQLHVTLQRRRAQSPKVLFDLRWLVPGKVGGVEQMTHELISELAHVDHRLEYRILGSAAVCDRWRFPPGFKHRLFPTDAPAVTEANARRARANDLAASLGMPPLYTPEFRALEWYAQLDFTIVHSLPCLVQPDLRRFPSVLTVHDLQHLHLPEYFSPEDIATREREYRPSCELAAHLICTSEFTRQDVHRRYGISLEKMTTIWNLPRAPEPAPGADADAATLARLGVRTPYFYYPAQPWLHKNHRGLFEALRSIEAELPSDYRVVLTGQPFPTGHPAAALLADPVIGRRVLHLGYRAPHEVSALYRGAEAMIFPSQFEGFGLPLLEAMQQDCPVVCGNHTCLPEIAGDAALVMDVHSAPAIGEAMLRICRDRMLRDTLRQSGRANLRRFDRKSLAEKTRDIYVRVHAGYYR